MKKNRDWLFKKYKKEFIELNNAYSEPPSSDITKQSYLASFGNYYIKENREYSGPALYAIFWRALNDSDKAIDFYNKEKLELKELVEDKKDTVKKISKINEFKPPEQLNLFDIKNIKKNKKK